MWIRKNAFGFKFLYIFSNNPDVWETMCYVKFVGDITGPWTRRSLLAAQCFLYELIRPRLQAIQWGCSVAFPLTLLPKCAPTSAVAGRTCRQPAQKLWGGIVVWIWTWIEFQVSKIKAENGSADRIFFWERSTGRWSLQNVFGNWHLLIIASGGESYYETRYTCQSRPQFATSNYSWKYQTVQLGFNVQITQWVMFHVMYI